MALPPRRSRARYVCITEDEGNALSSSTDYADHEGV
jgi:hypothetical protein